jgi:hypothetical protein
MASKRGRPDSSSSGEVAGVVVIFRRQSVECFHFAEFRAECRLWRRRGDGIAKGIGVSDKALN